MDATEILAMFVAKIDSRETLLKPFRIGDFVYATNGHWCARVPAEGIEAGDATDKHPKNIEGLFDKAPTEGFMPLPDVPDPGACMSCKGRGFGRNDECDACDGDGSFWHHDHNYDCKSCNGNGDIFTPSASKNDPCPHCYGHGVESNTGGTKVGEATFSNRYLWLLRKLPGIEIAPGESEKAARIRFDGGEGLLMPYRD